MEQNILELGKKYGIDLLESSIESNNMGLDFQVVMGTDKDGEEWILRIPRRKDVFSKVQTEKKILEIVGHLQDVFQVPNWEVFTEELIAYKQLKGVPAVVTNIESQETKWVFDEKNVPTNYIQTLGKALATLHAIPQEKAKQAGMPIEVDLRQSMKDRMDKVKKKYEIHTKLWNRWESWLENEELWPKQAGFIHGDLFPGHTLVDKENKVTGIIDWTEARYADVSTDFTAFYLLFGEEVLDELIKAYANAGGYTWPMMKEHIIELLSTQGLTIAEFAMTSGLKEYDEMAKQILGNAPE